MSDHSDRERGSSSRIDRRSVLRGIAAGGTAAVGVGAMSGTASAAEEQCAFGLNLEEAPDEYPVVERDPGFLGIGAGGLSETGDVPEGEDEVVVYIHGWLELFTGGAADQGYTLQRALRDAGSDIATLAYNYPSSSPNWWGQKDGAETSGREFASWLQSYREENPDTDVRLIVHSLGARAGAGLLDELVNEMGGEPVRSLEILGGAISREAVTVDGEFGDALANGAEEVNNYWSSGDNILDEIFQIGEFGTEAVGAKGAPEDAETPDNYNDIDVTGIVRGHCLYYDPDRGCIDTVVENFPEGFQGGGDPGDKFDDWF
ncbi:alpha/beta hydrolase [Halorientalis sp. IM1011]|uniref:alpha/beta hydrolase n=1 Tax=Halorientalis sp. IM1011 TaxID=1932360 RepID=UPI0009FF9E3C|nr:alpha/beta hydrolase [Halorientalis sp. IM1011]